MNKAKKLLLSMDLTMSIFVLIGLHIAIMGGSIGDAIAITSLVASKCFHSWLENQKPNMVNEKLAKDLEDVKSAMSGLMLKNSVRPQVNAHNEVKTAQKFF
jgi:hypothetical protein